LLLVIRGLCWGCYSKRDDGLPDQQGETATAIRSRLQQASDAKVAATIGPAQLTQGFFLSRWKRTSAAEKAYLLRYTVVDGDESSSTADMSERAGRKQGSMTMTGAFLISKGIIYPPGMGMADYIRRLNE
jgi:hypothetical protein